MGCHGSSRPWAMLPCNTSSSGCWKYIVKIGNTKVSNGLSLNSFFVGVIGDGHLINFWGDPWLHDVPLRNIYPNLFRLEKYKWVKVASRIRCENNIKTMVWDWRYSPSSFEQVTELFQLLSDIHEFEWQRGQDYWKWTKEKDGRFTVASAKRLLSDRSSHTNHSLINWKGWVPLKCKIMVWRVARNRIPTTSELIKRGVNIQQPGCSFCQEELETTLHIFTGCPYSHEVWIRLEDWCKLSHTFFFDIPDILRLPESLSLSKDRKCILRGIVYTALWTLWNERNDRIFNNKQRRPLQIVEHIKSTSYFWICNRSRWKESDWKTWCKYPFVCP